MDEREKRANGEQGTERHLRLVPPPQTRQNTKRNTRRFDWRIWTTLGVAVLLFGSIALQNRPPMQQSPNNTGFGQPIAFQGQGLDPSRSPVTVRELADEIALIEAAISQGEWSLADQRTDDLEELWISARATLTSQSSGDVWSSTDVAEFDAALNRLESWIEQRNMTQAMAEISVMQRTVGPYAQPEPNAPMNITR